MAQVSVHSRGTASRSFAFQKQKLLGSSAQAQQLPGRLGNRHLLAARINDPAVIQRLAKWPAIDDVLVARCSSELGFEADDLDLTQPNAVHVEPGLVTQLDELQPGEPQAAQGL